MGVNASFFLSSLEARKTISLVCKNKCRSDSPLIVCFRGKEKVDIAVFLSTVRKKMISIKAYLQREGDAPAQGIAAFLQKHAAAARLLLNFVAPSTPTVPFRRKGLTRRTCWSALARGILTRRRTPSLFSLSLYGESGRVASRHHAPSSRSGEGAAPRRESPRWRAAACARGQALTNAL